MKLVDLTYYCHRDMNAPSQAIALHQPSLGYVDFIKNKMKVEVIIHLNYEGSEVLDKINYSFFKSTNRFFYIPFKTHRHLKKQNPDMIHVHGLIFPIHVIFLRMALGRKCKIILTHHAESPFRGIKKMFQKLADKFVDGYVFTSFGNATEWVQQKVLPLEKVYEVIEASTILVKQNKSESRTRLNIPDSDIFLWVGRLEKNKDPITVLKGFEKYLRTNQGAKLYMIFQEENLLPEVKSMIQNNEALKTSVQLVGKINHLELSGWYSAADYYLSGSHREGSGYALIEAMACGCIPVVTNIPSFKKIFPAG